MSCRHLVILWIQEMLLQWPVPHWDDYSAGRDSTKNKKQRWNLCYAFQLFSASWLAKIPTQADSHDHSHPPLLWGRLDAVMTLNYFRAVRGWHRLQRHVGHHSGVCPRSGGYKLVSFLVGIRVCIVYVCLIFTNSKERHGRLGGLKVFDADRQEPLAGYWPTGAEQKLLPSVAV